jgi:putative peptidoglycan lipid II flippase
MFYSLKARPSLLEWSMIKASTKRSQLTSVWKSWSTKSVNARIFSAAIVVGSLGFAVKLLATCKEVVIAHYFGAGDHLDAFLIALLLPSFAINVISGSLNVTLIPTYIQVREQQGKEAAQQLFSSVVVWSSALLIAASVLLGIGGSYILPLLGSSFSPEKLALTRSLFYILLPTLLLTGLTSMWSAILNAGERFALAAISPAVTPIVVIALVYELGELWGIYAVSVAVILGAVLECMLLAASLRRHQISLMPRWRGMSPAMRQIMNQYIPMLTGSLILSSTGLIDNAMAAMLGPGNVSTLNYGNRIAAVIVTIGSVSLSTAVLPQFSRMAVAADWDGIRDTLKQSTRLILVITVPITVMLMLFSHNIVRVLFEGGAFTSENSQQVASVQSFYILQLPFYLVQIVFVRLIQALKANHILMWGTVFSFLLNAPMNYLFSKWLGVAGIALSTSVWYAFSFCYLRFMMWRLLASIEEKELLGSSSYLKEVL